MVEEEEIENLPSEPPGEGEETPEPKIAVVVATPTRAEIESLTLVVTPQNGMVLKYVEDTGARLAW